MENLVHLCYSSVKYKLSIQTFTTLSRVTGTLNEPKVYKVSIYVTDMMFVVNKTSSMPKYVLRFELDKDSTSNWKLPLTSVWHL